MDQCVYFEVYKKENGEIMYDTMEKLSFNLSMRMIDLRDEIMWKIYNSTEERASHDNYYLEIENISENLVKEFGKLFFNKGLLPKTIDNYPLTRITSGNNKFTFAVYRIKKSELKDYMPIKRLYEMSEEEKKGLNDKPAMKNKTFVKPAWDNSSEDEEEKKPSYEINSYQNTYNKKYNENDW